MAAYRRLSAASSAASSTASSVSAAADDGPLDATDTSASEDAPASEVTRLLPHHYQGRRPSTHSSEGHARSRRASIASSVAALHIPQTHDPRLVVVILATIVMLVSGAGGFWVLPATRILEERLCREYYDRERSLWGTAADGGGRGEDAVGGDLPEEMCKVDAVQTRLAFIFALMSSLEYGLGEYAGSGRADQGAKKENRLPC